MRINRIVGAALLCAALLSACSNGTTPEPSAPSLPTASPTPTSPSSTAGSTSQSPTSQAPTEQATEGVAFGKSVQLNLVKITVMEFDSRFPTPDIEEAPVMQAVLIKTCLTKEPPGGEKITIGWGPWSMTSPDGENYDASSWRWGGEKKPKYPDDEDRTFKKGQCSKGWVLFETIGKKVTELRYENSVGEIASWKLPKS